ncbi:hypothetical protein [Polaribacter glomeratus]|uniref:Fibronectin type-III domain-containing protein n=1 Tax=Polaribacter glomeratus TaxID=102 RepID=A0A2S7WJ48_9FLAO|nr:hypothetical protein [Polaribacter glomeratus]PQJ77322.1 hypothetical protein BTO16_15915 [Polaribacter glomeratus]TXD65906.1 hypothetical protein ESX12_07025 [Polaribacter glomeratus]
MKNYIKIGLLLFFVVILNSCSESTTANTAPVVMTNITTEITYTTATSGGDVTDDGGEIITSRGICWSTSQNPTILDNVIAASTNVFASNIIGLGQNGGTYYVRAYAINAVGTTYGNQEMFNSWKLDDTKWAFLLNYNVSNSNYPGDVDFFANATTKWDEPDYPGVYTTLGTWSVEGAVVTYNMTGDSAATSYIYTGTSVNNTTMSGTFTWGANPAKTFTATKYP